MDKLSKTALVLDRIIKVMRGICIGVSIACAIFLLLAAFLPDSQYDRLFNYADTSVSLGNVVFHLSSVVEPSGSIRLSICFILLTTAASLFLSVWGLNLLHRILLPMSQQQPFSGSVSGDLKTLGWLTLAGTLVFGILSAIADTLSISMYDLNQLFILDLVTGYTVEHTVDVALLLIPALLFLLSYVFRYGEELQKQSDETL